MSKSTLIKRLRYNNETIIKYKGRIYKITLTKKGLKVNGKDVDGMVIGLLLKKGEI